MLETVITDVFVAQVYWEAVPKTWPRGSKASVRGVCVSVLSRLQFLADFDEIGTDVWNLRRKIPFVGVKIQ